MWFFDGLSLDASIVVAFAFFVSFLHHSNGESRPELTKLHTSLMILCHVMWFFDGFMKWSVDNGFFYILNTALTLSLYCFFLSGGHVVGTIEYDGDERVHIVTPRNRFYEEMMIFYNLYVTFIMILVQ
jgi:hypothetical protein